MLHSWHCLCRMPTLREGSKSTKFVNSLSYCALVNTQAFVAFSSFIITTIFLRSSEICFDQDMVHMNRFLSN
uniref:Uncharacterized protein n=1 Tax=Anguilla anguilla TaxID=7936 RepID=A0A0E9RIA1_ANGAN